MVETESEDCGRRPRPQSPWAKKRRRLLKWLAVLIVLLLPVVLWRANLSHETRVLLRAQEAAGRPVTLAELNDRSPAVPAAENGAKRYLEARSLFQAPPALLRERVPFFQFRDLDPGTQLSPEQRNGAAEWLALNEETMARLRAAALLPRSSYLAPYRPAGYNDYSIVIQLSDLSGLACADAVVRAEQGDSKGASAALSVALAIPRSMSREGIADLQAAQWRMEGQVLEALQYAMGRVRISEETLVSFAAWFSPEHRRAEIGEMARVEQCLFLARLREGYRRGMARNLLIASGVGDMNAQVYMGLMGSIFAWLDATPSAQGAIEEGYGRALHDAEKRPLLYLTLNLSPPPGHWVQYRRALDEAALVQVGVALYRYHIEHGSFPDTLGGLAPTLTEVALKLPSSGAAIQYRHESGRAALRSTPSVSGAGLGELTEATSPGPSSAEMTFIVAAPHDI